MGKLFYIDAGHNAPSKDTGSSGCKSEFFEDKLTMLVAKKVTEYIRLNSEHQAICPEPAKCSSVQASLSDRVNKANQMGANVFVSIHFNAFNGKVGGTEIFVRKEESEAIAQRVLNKIVALGFKNRGVKRADYFVIHPTALKAKEAILVECCFCDNPDDMKLFTVDTMAEAIAEGLLNKDIPPAKELEIEPQPCLLTVNRQTYLKPSTEMSNEIPKNELVTVLPGQYDVELIGDEEGHFLVSGIKASFGRGFVYSGHCNLIPQ